ncbi:N-acetyltransferase [Maridesulfovibrio salexigens]|uniref:GCN5-related N-acetyltransferase n=1 Tax=Maridesulfovibrio salexigens (strain ATCC 14822 / DSM 2638 / NCIMB 8403 / VKM B-1763) TaxID=526222 RepID=C6BSU1_MARSD|nr:N-acetyltransferase [Maridesulfovibrio salexigens]ACS81547.1 GCN5-related N-acetyltransferase [Maridesulfovibrio salexigens DSM 2638]
MIRKALPEEYGLLSSLWLEASIKAHYFVPAEFWESNVDAMRNEYLPAAETLVIEKDGDIAGFISLIGETVAALFISVDKQGAGLGSQLLQHAKDEHENLNLCVYKENGPSVSFYTKHGFTIVEDRVDEHTGRVEILMDWQR